MEAYALTDVGQKRSMNQDSVYACTKSIGSLENLFIVADIRLGILLPTLWWKIWSVFLKRRTRNGTFMEF